MIEIGVLTDAKTMKELTGKRWREGIS